MPRKIGKPRNLNNRVQTKPWDTPPQPVEVCHFAPEPLYTAMGSALSAWESVEEHLASLFSVIIGHHAPSFPAVRAYGAIQTFRGRSEMLVAAAEAYFERHPDPALVNRFDDVLERASGFSSKRNDIAHGRVHPIKDRKLTKYFLFPSSYSTGKITTQGAIAYVYTSKIISDFEKHFVALAADVDALINLIAARHGMRKRKRKARPSRGKGAPRGGE